MKWWQALVLGLIQGLTEFLPVSSSGHLTFLQRVLGIDIGGAELFFNIILHLGTLVAVCIIFWRDILDLFKKPFKTLLYLVVATIPAAIAGLLLDDVIEEHLMGGKYVGVVLAVFFTVTAAVLFATEVFAKRRKKELPICWRTTLPMGFAQAVAILPGISRSGSTIAAGTFAGGTAEDTSKFSFLMSIPVILGSFFVELVKGLIDKEKGFAYSFSVAGPQFGWCIAIGLIISAVAGLFAIKVMLAAIKKANYKWFSLYLVLLAVTCVVLQCVGLFN
ncbi:MAG: undecaprenyl-diphosphate phosphatase [Clostridia bacterium]|nr:undecaprenyl-diphosphate phosphatase [Clostridia bacterium]